MDDKEENKTTNADEYVYNREQKPWYEWSISEEREQEIKKQWNEESIDQRSDTDRSNNDLEGYVINPESKALTPIRVGYIIYSTFNGKLQFIQEDRNKEIIITIATDDMLKDIEKSKIVGVPKVLEILTSYKAGFINYKFKISSFIMSTINETFVITELMPSQPMGIYAPVIHPYLCYQAAINALLTCFICWPTNKLDVKSRWHLTDCILSGVPKSVFSKMIRYPKRTSMIELIQNVNDFYMGNDVRMIQRVFSKLSPTEMSILALNVPNTNYDDYLKAINASALGEPDKVASSVNMINDLYLVISRIEKIDETREERKLALQNLKSKFQEWASIKHGLKKFEIESLQMISEKIIEVQDRFKSYLAANHRIEYLSTVTNFEQKRVVLSSQLSEPLDSFQFQLALERLYDHYYKFCVKTLRVTLRLITRAIDRLDSEDEEKIGELVQSFFSERNLTKRVALNTGGIRGLKSLTALSHFLYTVIPFIEQEANISNDDREIIGKLRSRMNKLTKDRASLPVQAVIGLVSHGLHKIIRMCPEESQALLESRLRQFELSANYNQAWSTLTRLKGEIYEPLFAETWGLTYLPEDQKPTLLTVLRQTLPSKVPTFNQRTQNHPEVRDFKPDFILVKVPPFSANLYGIIPEQRDTIPIMQKDSASSKSDAASLAQTDISTTVASRVFVQRKEIGTHELGNDDYIQKTVFHISDVINKFVQHGKEANAKGGIITENKLRQPVIIETVYQPIGTSKTPKIVGFKEVKKAVDEALSKIEDFSNLPMKPDAASVSTIASESDSDDGEATTIDDRSQRKQNSDSSESDCETLADTGTAKTNLVMTKDWNCVNYQSDFDLPEILILEVGYQTDQERKIVSDIKKWHHAVEILRSLKIKVTVISAVDTTGAKPENWWIRKEYVSVIKSTVGAAFWMLDQNSPLDITEMVISDISSQKIRANLRSGSIIRPPILSSDVMTYYQRWRESFIKRPSGVTIPSRIESDLIQSQVFGATIRQDKDLLSTIVNQLVDKCPEIIERYKRTDRKFEVISNNTSANKFLVGWLTEDLSISYCQFCLTKKNERLKKLEISSRIIESSGLLNEASYCELCLKEIRINSDRTVYNNDFLHLKTEAFFLKELNIHTEIEEEVTGKHIFDKFCCLSMSTKSQKQKKIKTMHKRICEKVLYLNDQCGYKDSKGQIFISKYYTLVQKNLTISDLKNYKPKRERKLARRELETIEEEGDMNEFEDGLYAGEYLNKVKSLPRKKQFIFTDITKDFKLLKGLAADEMSQEHNSIINEMQQNLLFDEEYQPKSVLKREWLDGILNCLDIERDSKEFVRKITDSFSKYQTFQKQDDRMPIISTGEVSKYLNQKSIELDWLSSEECKLSWSCIFMEESINECKARLRGTVYESTPDYIKEVTELLLSFRWFQRIAFYSKLCQIFLTCCSEFSHSGIKVKKIPHTNLNIVIKVPESKQTNMLCCIRDHNMGSTGYGKFFLNRRVAILGQSLPYCYVVCFIQLAQTYCCLGAIISNKDGIKFQYKTAVYKRYSKAVQSLIATKEGYLDRALQDVYGPVENYNPAESNQTIVFSSLLIGFNISFGILIGPSIALNSPVFNKQLQTIRYPYMLSLAEYGMPGKLGEKMSNPRRRIETEVSRLFLMLSCYGSLKSVEDNIKSWKADQFRPITSLVSVSVFGSRILCDRHFLFDIYLVHIYNKEIDDFETNQIKVFTDFAERHVSWEEDLKKAIIVYNQKGEDPKIRSQSLRRMRLLLGIPKLDTKKQKRDTWQKLKKSLRGGTERNFNTKSVSTDKTTSSTDTGSESNSSTGSDVSIVTVPSFYQGAGGSAPFRCRSSHSYTIELPGAYKITRGEETGDQEILKPVSHEVFYIPKFEDLYEDILEIINHNPKHSYASYELLQLAAEASKKEFNIGAIEKSRRSPLNWKPITSVIETTSIISKPMRKFNTVDAVVCIKRNISKKLMKLMKQRLDHSKDVSTKEQKETLLEFFKENMLCLGEQWENIAEGVVKATNDNNKLDYVTWQHQVQLPIDETLMTTDANQVYYWIKSVASAVRKKKNNRQYKELTSEDEYCLNKIREKLDDKRFLFIDDEYLELVKTSNKLWKKTTLFMIESMKAEGISVEKIRQLGEDHKELMVNYKSLKEQKETYESANYRDEENALMNLESKFIQNYSLELAKIFNLLLIHTISCPWLERLEAFELKLIYMKNVVFETNEYDVDTVIKAIVLLLDLDEGMEDILNVEKDLVVDLCRYVIIIFQTSGLPMRYQYEYHDATIDTNNHLQLLEEMKSLLAELSFNDKSFDFMLSIQTIRAKNFLSMKRLMNRSGNDRLPRSVRSKVLYELVKSTQESKQAILQQQAFGAILNMEHRNFATLAPKGQLGATRDLLVQERDTKLINAASELFQMSILQNTISDILANPKMKDVALNEAGEQKRLADMKHATPYGSIKEQDADCIQFFNVFVISGDHGKWGPVHSCSTFNAIDQQLLISCHDWKNFNMLVNLKSLNKNIEIPSPSIEKVFKAYINSKEYSSRQNTRLTKDKVNSDMNNLAENWKWTGYMNKIIEWYLSKGEACLNSYNHMGQGIHHKKSSVLGKCDRDLLSIIVKQYFEGKLPKLNLEVIHYGSSDDFMVIFKVTGKILKNELELMEEQTKLKICDCLNVWSALSRCMQMYVSEKTVVSSCVAEIYSDFHLYHRMSPSVIKFIISSLINTTVNTPLTLYQSTHVCSQQAAMMSTSYLTNLAFCLGRQQILHNHIEGFMRSYGPLIFQLFSSFGRLYIPRLSTLLTNSADTEDLMLILESCTLMIKYLNCCEPVDIYHDGQRPAAPSKEAASLAKVSAWVKEVRLEDEFENDIQKEAQGNSENPELIISENYSLGNLPNFYIREKKVSLTEVSSEIEGETSDSVSIGHTKSFDGSIDQIEQEFQKVTDSTVLDPNVDHISEPSNIDAFMTTSQRTEWNNRINKLDLELNENVKKLLESVDLKISSYNEEAPELTDKKLLQHCHTSGNQEFLKEAFKLSETNELKLLHSCMETSECSTVTLAKKVIIANILLMIISEYDVFKADGIERAFKGLNAADCQMNIEDPFLFMLPDHVQGCLKRLGLIKSELGISHEEMEALEDNAGYLAKSLIESNNATEEYSCELQRIKQIVNSRNIINKLSGGMKEHSLPYIRMCYNGYMFNNKLNLKLTDHWSKTKDPSIKSNAGKSLKGKEKVRYRNWVDNVIKVKPVIPLTEVEFLSEFDCMLNPRVCLTTNITNDPNNTIVCIYNKLSLLSLCSDLAKFVDKSTGYNKQRILEAEENPSGREIPAPHVVITKTKLFSREANLKLANNPAVVIAYLLDTLASDATKPIGMHLSELETDKQSLLSFYPHISQIIVKIKNNEMTNLEEIKKVQSVLLNFCRKLSATSLTSTPFYAFRPFKSTYDDSSSSIVSFGTIEGSEVLIDEGKIYSATFSERYYRIMEAISAISAFPISNDRKTQLLRTFLLWNPHNTTSEMKVNENIIQCGDLKDEHEAKQVFDNSCISVQLVSEAQATRSSKTREEIMNIANLAIHEAAIGMENRRTDLRLTFKTEGQIFTDGRFQLSCEYGSAVGMFLDRRLIITISQRDVLLLETIETEVLRWCYGSRITILTKEWHIKFIELLPSYAESYKLLQYPDAFTPRIVIDKNIARLELINYTEHGKAIYYKSNLLTVRSHHPDRVSVCPKLRWTKGRLSIYITDETVDLTTSTYIPLVINIIKMLDYKKADEVETTTLKQRDVLVCNIELPKTISYTSFLILHLFLHHRIDKPANLGKNTQELMDTLNIITFPTHLVKLITEDKSLELIKEYALNKSQLEKDYEQKMYESVKKAERCECEYDGMSYMMNDNGIFLNQNDRLVELSVNDRNYGQVVELLQKQKLKTLNDDLNLPSKLQTEVAREFEVALMKRDDEQKRQELSRVINRNFKDISAWPFIELLLNEIGMSNFTIQANKRHTDESVEWIVASMVGVKGPKPPKDILSSIESVRMKQIPIEFSYSVITRTSVSGFVKSITDLHWQIQNLPLHPLHIQTTISLLIYFKYLTIDSTKITYDWIDLLRKSLPFYIDIPGKESQMMFRIIAGNVVCQLNVMMSDSSYDSMLKQVDVMEKEFETDKESKIKDAQRKGSRKSAKKLKKFIEMTENKQFNKEVALAEKVNEYIVSELPFTGVRHLPEIVMTINRLRVIGGYKYSAILDSDKLLSKIGLLTFCSRVLNLNTYNTQLALGVSTLIFSKLFGYRPSEELNPHIDCLDEFIRVKQDLEIKRGNKTKRDERKPEEEEFGKQQLQIIMNEELDSNVLPDFDESMISDDSSNEASGQSSSSEDEGAFDDRAFEDDLISILNAAEPDHIHFGD